MMEQITIVVIAYNRKNSLIRLLKSLNNIIIPKNEQVRLYISIDRSAKEDQANLEVYNVAQDYKWPYGEKIVDYKEKNLGLKEHVLSCGNLTAEYNNIIVLEDDIVVSPMMYIYAKQVLEFYKNEEKIAGFGLYSFQRNPINNLPFIPINNTTDVYFLQYACSWGQLWTKEKWKNFYEWYLTNKDTDFSSYQEIPNNIKKWGEKSWLKYYTIYTILNDKYFVYPQVGLTTNFTDKGTHSKEESIAYQCTTYLSNTNDVQFKFIDFKSAQNKYDSYFENTELNSFIDIKEKISSDLYGEKPFDIIHNYGNYLLSTKKYDFKIIKSYSLSMYPYEANILNNIYGKDLYLYDLKTKNKNKNKNNRFNILRYLYKLCEPQKKDILILTMAIFKCVNKKIVNKFKSHTR